MYLLLRDVLFIWQEAMNQDTQHTASSETIAHLANSHNHFCTYMFVNTNFDRRKCFDNLSLLVAHFMMGYSSNADCGDIISYIVRPWYLFGY